MRSSLLRATLLVGLWPAFAATQLLGQQPANSLRPAIDSLLSVSRVDATIQGLGNVFLDEVVVLVPDLSADQIAVLAAAVAEGFAPAAVRADVAGKVAEEASPDLVRALLTSHRSGAMAELAGAAAAFQPQGTVNDFMERLGPPPRDRLQRMVQLAELEGRGSLDLLLEESLQELAHSLVTQLGGRLPPFERMTDERFEELYRDRVIQMGFSNLHRLQPVSDELLGRALDDLSGEAGRWYVDAYTTAVIEAAGAAAARVLALTAVGDYAPVDSVEGALHCQGAPCLIWVDWEGSEPDVFNLRFGAPGDLGARVMDHLVGARYQLGGGLGETRFMIRLVPRLRTTLCDYMSGTDNTRCEAIGEVRVEFRNRYGELPNPAGFNVLNRCGSDGVQHVSLLAAYVAARIQHALHRPSEPTPPTPRC